jgi:predicted fused transcriptional regulator/phosphomethylpyrimidine kinase
VRGGATVARAAQALGWPLTPVGPRRAETADPDAAVLKAMARAAEPVTVHDPGAVGIEPCLYLAGADATAVARRILQLDEALTP